MIENEVVGAVKKASFPTLISKVREEANFTSYYFNHVVYEGLHDYYDIFKEECDVDIEHLIILRPLLYSRSRESVMKELSKTNDLGDCAFYMDQMEAAKYTTANAKAYQHCVYEAPDIAPFFCIDSLSHMTIMNPPINRVIAESFLDTVALLKHVGINTSILNHLSDLAETISSNR